MEWLNVIVGAISTIIGLIGGGVGIYYWKESKELKKAEARKGSTEARLAEADLAEKILEKYEKGILARMDTGDAVRKQEFEELTTKLDHRFDIIEEEDRKQNETLRDVIEYLNGGFKQFEESKRKKNKKVS